MQEETKSTLDKLQEKLARDLVILEESGVDPVKIKRIESAYMIIYDILNDVRNK